MKKAFSRPGKIMKFEKKRPKSWKNHGISKYLCGKIMEKEFPCCMHYVQNYHFVWVIITGEIYVALKGRY